MSIKNFFREKRLSFYFMAAAAALLLTALIMYSVSWKSQFLESTFSEKISPVVITIFVIAIAGACVSLWREFEMLGYGVYLMSLVGFLLYLTGNASYIVNIFVGIDETPWSGTFIFITVISLLAWASALASAIIFSVQNRRRAQRQNAPVAGYPCN